MKASARYAESNVESVKVSVTAPVMTACPCTLTYTTYERARWLVRQTSDLGIANKSLTLPSHTHSQRAYATVFYESRNHHDCLHIGLNVLESCCRLTRTVAQTSRRTLRGRRCTWPSSIYGGILSGNLSTRPTKPPSDIPTCLPWVAIAAPSKAFTGTMLTHPACGNSNRMSTIGSASQRRRLVIGGSRGLGMALVQAEGATGGSVDYVSRTANAGLCQKHIKADLTQARAINAIAAHVGDAKYEAIYFCAAYAATDDDIFRDEALAHSTMSLNLLAPIKIAEAAYAAKAARETLQLIFISSLTAVVPMTSYHFYGGLKRILENSIRERRKTSDKIRSGR